MEEGLLSALEFSAADDHGLIVPGERRHGAEGEVAAIAVGVDAGATHAAFGLVGHGIIFPISAAARTMARRVHSSSLAWGLPNLSSDLK